MLEIAGFVEFVFKRDADSTSDVHFVSCNSDVRTPTPQAVSEWLPGPPDFWEGEP